MFSKMSFLHRKKKCHQKTLTKSFFKKEHCIIVHASQLHNSILDYKEEIKGYNHNRTISKKRGRALQYY